MFRHILVPTDGSAPSRRAERFAVKLAQSTGARITALHLIPGFAPTDYLDVGAIYPQIYSPREYKRSSEEAATRLMARIVKLAEAADVPCETLFRTADAPWKAIIDTARRKRCDLIVMASHGRRGLEAVLLGSETTKVLTHSKTPVLVYR